MPALGGPERKLVDLVCWSGTAGYANWTPDGKSLVFEDSCIPDGPISIVVFSLETGVKRCLAAPPSNEFVDRGPVLSPDGKTVAFLTSDVIAAASDIYTVPLAGGKPRRLTFENKHMGRVMWAGDGQHICFDSDRSGLGRLWRIPAGGGAIEPETTYPSLGWLSRDGRRLAYQDASGSTSIWRADLSRAGGPVLGVKPTISAPYEDLQAQPSSDGRRIVFTSARTGKFEIWKSDVDGSDQVQLTSLGGSAGSPRWSPDGKWIAYDYRPATRGQIYLMDADGRNQRQITSGDYENVVPSWSHDGTAIYFTSTRTGDNQIWKRELATGRETQITRQGGDCAVESYDAKTLYYTKVDGGGIWSVPVAGGEELQITEALHRGYRGYFAVTDFGLYMVDSETKPGPAIMYYSFQTRRLTSVLPLKQDVVTWSTNNLAATRDGRTILFVQLEHKSSIIMVEYQ